MAESSDSSPLGFLWRHFEEVKEHWKSNFSFLDYYKKTLGRKEPLPKWTDADVEEFIASDPIYGPQLQAIRESRKYAVAGALLGGAHLGGVSLKYSKSPHGPWTPTEKDLLLLAQVEEALIQVQAHPNMKAFQHLAGLIISWSSMKNWPAQDDPASSTLRNTTRGPTWLTLNGQPPVTSSTTLGSSSLSASSRRLTFGKDATARDKAPTGKMPYQLSPVLE